MSDEANVPSIVEFSVDLNEQEAPKPLPAGEYTATIRGAEIKKSNRDTTYAAVQFFISPEQYPADFQEGNPDGTVVTYRRVSLEDNPQARFSTKRFIEAIGGKLGKRVDVNEWVGLEALVDISHDTYEGVTRPQIAKVRSL